MGGRTKPRTGCGAFEADEGLPAYHQRHVIQGTLGVFLQAVSEGRIVPGSVFFINNSSMGTNSIAVMQT